MSETRQEKSESYTEGGELKPLSWGRLRIGQKAFDHIDDDDAPEVAAALYLMEFQKLRDIGSNGSFVEKCKEFCEPLEIRMVVKCAEALGRDLEAAGLSMVEPVESVKDQAPEEREGPNQAETDASSQQE